jgi:hypothetical protein
MDGAAFLRILRSRLSSTPADRVQALPGEIAAIAHSRNLVPVLRRLDAQHEPSQTYCDGYLPVCPGNQSFSQGAYFSVLCRDEAPFSDLDVLPGLAAGDPSWTADYVHSPYLDVCAAWGVQPGDRAITQPVTSDVPVFIENGGLSPFVDRQVIQAGMTGLSNASIGISPSNGDGGYFDRPHCEDLRASFFDHPRPTVDASCYQDATLHFDVSPEGSS